MSINKDQNLKKVGAAVTLAALLAGVNADATLVGTAKNILAIGGLVGAGMGGYHVATGESLIQKGLEKMNKPNGLLQNK